MVELERNIRRGGVYWVRSMDEWGGTAGSLGRPAVVVSNDYGNTRARDINVVFCSSQIKPHVCNVVLSGLDKPTMAKCNQLAVVDKDRLGQKIGDVSDAEMEQINETLALCLGLTLHKRDVDEALEAEKTKVAGLEEELMGKRVEIAMLERLYEKALDMMAGVRLTNDLQPKREPVKVRVPRVVPDEPEVDEEIDRRTAVADKVNVNTAGGMEIHEKVGISKSLAYSISGYRNKNGPYGCLEDLLKVDRFTQRQLDKYRERLTV